MDFSLRRDVSATVDLRRVLGSLVMHAVQQPSVWYGGFCGADQIEDSVTLSIS